MRILFFSIIFTLVFASPASVFAFEIENNRLDFKSAIIPNDLYFDKQWYLKKIKAPDAWSILNKKKEVIIAIIDSGVQIDHPDLKDNMWINKNEIAGNSKDDDGNGYIDDVYGWDFVNNTNDPNPKFDDNYTEEEVTHGTIVAGIAAASGNNQEGVSGVAWDAKIMALMALDSRGAGSISAVVKAIEYAIDNGADIINLSFSGNVYSPQLEAAIRRANESGILVVAAAGNESENPINLDENPMYPACSNGYSFENLVIGVAATDPLDQKSTFSAYGENCVDISAPGVSIYNTTVFSPREKDGIVILDKFYDGYWSGTSMAAPQVSGALALMISANPGLSKNELFEILLDSSDYIERLNPEYKNQLGAGRLNIFKAVHLAQERLRDKNPYLINTPGNGKKAQISVTDKNGKQLKNFEVLNGLDIDVNTISADINGNGKKEIIVSAGLGGGPQIQIYDFEGRLLSQFFAFNENFKGGVSLAVGDVNRDGVKDIVVAAGPGGGPHVRVFNGDGEILRQFFAFSEDFRGGVNVSSADVSGNGFDEIIVAAGAGGGPQVRVFDNLGNMINQFFVFNESFRGGVNVVAINDKGGPRKLHNIAVSEASSGSSLVRIFDLKGRKLSEFKAFGEKYKDRVNISAGDIDNDGQDELICSAGPGGTPHVRIYEANGVLVGAYMAFDEEYSGGVNTSIIIK